jgi:uncharacterized Ntn-hydrolase superfamily protein
MPQKVVTVANPAAGADFTATVPAGEFWIVLAVAALLTSDATVQNRTVKLIIDNGTDTLFQGGNSGTGQQASVAGQYSFAPNLIMELAQVIGGLVRFFPIPGGTVPIVLSPGYRVRSATGSLAAGDQWSNIRLVVLAEVSERGLRKPWSV